MEGMQLPREDRQYLAERHLLRAVQEVQFTLRNTFTAILSKL
jgi:hypothetical protein